MSHYFENDKKLPSEIKMTTAKLNGIDFTFYTDNGVFAKKGLDYGSKLLLEALLEENLLQKSILDVGCGYGVLGIILAKLCQAHVEMIDVNHRALHLAKKNAKENGNLPITIYESNCYENVEKKYDVIVTNPPIRAGKKVVYEILFSAKEHLQNNGSLYFVIRKEQGAKSIISDLKKVYDITILNRSKGFFIIKAKTG